jgi:hypothetical protein
MIAQHCSTFKLLFNDLSQQLFGKDEDETRVFHPGEFGSHRELVSSTFLKPFTPDRFDLADGFILGQEDSNPAQCDILVVERDLAPFCTNRELGQFYPIEAISAVGEVKSQLTPTQFSRVLAQVSRQACEAKLRATRDAARFASFDEIWPDPQDSESSTLLGDQFRTPLVFLICRRFAFGAAPGTLPLWVLVRKKIDAVVRQSPNAIVPELILSVTDGLLIRRAIDDHDEYQCISPGKDSTTHLKKFLSIYFSHHARWRSQRVSFQRYFQVSELDMVFDDADLSVEG